MDLMGMIAKDQTRIFGNTKDFGEMIEYTDELGNSVELAAFIERENVEPKTAGGYGAPLSRNCVHIWIPQGEEGRTKIKAGVDRVKLLWRRGDATRTQFLVTTVLPDSDGAWHVECTK